MDKNNSYSSFYNADTNYESSYLSGLARTMISNNGSLISDSDSSGSGIRIGRRADERSSNESSNGSSNSDFTAMINRCRIETCDSNDTINQMDLISNYAKSSKNESSDNLEANQRNTHFGGNAMPNTMPNAYQQNLNLVDSELNLDGYLQRTSSGDLPTNIFNSGVIVYRKYKYSDMYIAEIINAILYNLFITNGIIIFTFLNTPTYINYLIRIILHTLTLGMLMFLHCNEETTRSINITIEFLLINSIIYNYRFCDILNYIAIQLICAILVNLFIFTLYYNFIDIQSVEQLIDIFITQSPFGIQSPFSIPNGVSNSTTSNNTLSTYNIVASNAIGITIHSIIIAAIVDITTSIEYKKIIIYKLYSFMFINIVFSLASNGIYSIGYNTAIRIIIACWHVNTSALTYPDYVWIIQLSFTLILVPLLSYFTKMHIRQFYNTYMN